MLLVGDIQKDYELPMGQDCSSAQLCIFSGVFSPDLKMGGKRQWLRGSKVDGDLKKDLLYKK